LANHVESLREVETLVILRAIEVFGDNERAMRWMQEGNPALSNQSPERALQTPEGRAEVLEVLGRIEHGVLS